MNEYENELIKLMKKAYKKKEIPFAAIIVKNGKIISKAYNKRMKLKSVLAHAEILAIQKATKKLNDWRLNGCDMYVTLKPCLMCESVIKTSRMDNCFYFAEKLDYKKEYNKTKIIYQQTNAKKLILDLMQKSFKKLRSKG